MGQFAYFSLNGSYLQGNDLTEKSKVIKSDYDFVFHLELNQLC